MTLLTAAKIDYRTVRRLLARMLKVPEATNTKSNGLYAWHNGDHITVRLYRNHEKIYEAKVPPSEFPTEHMVAQLMLIA